MKRRHRCASSLVLVAFAVTTLLASAVPAAAATTAWDPHDMRGRFDLRWVGVYRQDADTIRLGIRLWHPIRRWNFDQTHGIVVSLNPFDQDADAWVHPGDGGGWVARFYDEGVPPPLFHARVTHPRGTLFRLFLPAEWVTGEEITVKAVANGAEDWAQVIAP
jgi:hypothetical protein